MTRYSQPSDRRRATISIVVPVYNESSNVEPLHQALDEVTRAHPELDWEFIFVDDGSQDDTFTRLSRLSDTDERAKVAQLSRNFGAHTATIAGLQFAAGDAAVVVPADLQDHPREISRLLDKWREGFHVVWGIRTNRDDSALDRLFSRLFALMIRKIALPNYPHAGAGGIWLIDRLVINALNAFKERNQAVSGLILFSGFRQTEISYTREKRHSGASKWSLRRKLSLTLDYIVAFSVWPLRFASLSGLVIALLAFLYMLDLIVSRLVYGTTVPGFTQSVVLLLMLGGLQLVMLGVLGEYLWRALDDVRRRPLFFVQNLRGDFSRYRPPLPPERDFGLPPRVTSASFHEQPRRHAPSSRIAR